MTREPRQKLEPYYLHVHIITLFCFSFRIFFAYKRHNFFLFKTYILHMLVISGTKS